MVEIVNAIIGSGIIVLNLIPFLLRKPRYLFLTILVSLLMLFLLWFLRAP